MNELPVEREAKTAGPLWVSEKILPHHRDRLAIVYVRQSTMQQTIHHQESTRLQYALSERAEALGWPPDRVEVIDDDQGLSGASAVGRVGFQRLVAEVGLDHVGLILGIEMSRLARSCKDFHHLLEVCALFGTLIGDADGLYDPSQYNDRLLLGLKGTMSEAELHILKQRMHQGKLNKATRGELGMRLPIGYFRRASGEVVQEIDEEARHVVGLIFEQFERLGSASAVLQYFVEHGIQLPVRAYWGPATGELQWHRPTRTTLGNVLHNPIYAGAYVYGRRPTDPRRKKAGQPGSGRTFVPRGSWQVLLKDRLVGYISWEQFERNQARLANNRNTASAQGHPRNGRGLLAGLIWCGRCGLRMQVQYSTQSKTTRYICQTDRVHYGAPPCQSFSANALEEFLSHEVLRALQPAALEVSLQVARELEAGRHRLDAHWKQQLERASYEAQRAERQYHSVEPENRLVARSVEKIWEQKLAAERQVQEEYRRYQATEAHGLTADQQEQIRRLASDFPALWKAPSTTNAQRRELLRAVLERVVVTLEGTSEKMDVRIHWAGGYKSRHRAVRPVGKLAQLSNRTELLSRVQSLHNNGKTVRQIATTLDREGWRPPKRRGGFTRGVVRRLLNRQGLRRVRRPHPTRRQHLEEHQWWLPSLAVRLGVPTPTLYGWIRRGLAKGRQLDGKYGFWIVWADGAELQRLERLRQRRRSPADDAPQVSCPRNSASR